MMLTSCVCFHSMCEMGLLPIILHLKDSFRGELRHHAPFYGLVVLPKKYTLKILQAAITIELGNRIPGWTAEFDISHADGE